MSHFKVLVIGENPTEQIAKYNEQLKVEWVDKTQEYRDEYENKMVDEFYSAQGSSWGFRITEELFNFITTHKVGATTTYVVEKLEPFQYIKGTGGCYRGYYQLPKGKRCEGEAWFRVDEIIENNHWNPESDTCFEGKVRISVIEPPKEIAIKDKYPDYEDYLKHWHGLEPNEPQGYWDNPNGKWDWFEVGGRYTGSLKTKPNKTGITGKPGLDTPIAKDGWCDQALKGDIDFEGMRVSAEEKAAELYDKVFNVVGHLPAMEDWTTVRERFGSDKIDEARDFYHDQPRVKALAEYNKNHHQDGEYLNVELEEFNEAREEYIRKQGVCSLSCLVLVKNGEWFERGSMGWWGVISDDTDRYEWCIKLKETVDALSDDTLLTILDCHV